MGALTAAILASCLPVGLPPAGQVRVDLDRVPPRLVADIVGRHLWGAGFSVEPSVEALTDTVSLKLAGTYASVRAQLVPALAAAGIVPRVTGHCFVSFGVPAVLGPPPPVVIPDISQVYRPRFRPAADLAAAVSGSLSESPHPPASASSSSVSAVHSSASRFPSSRSASAIRPGGSSDDTIWSILSARDPTAPSAAPDSPTSSATPLPVSAGASVRVGGPDEVVVSGAPRDVHRVMQLLSELDRRRPSVTVRAAVLEVSSSANTTSPFGLAMSVLQTRLGVQQVARAGVQPLGVLTSATIDTVISNLSTDSRFRVVTAPTVRALDGQTASFSSGSSVPTVGSVSYEGVSGSPVQSVVYRDSGVIFKVTPTVMRSSVSLQLHQEVSNFSATNTGVSSSPTLNQRSLDTTLDLVPGRVVVLGGLSLDSSSKPKRGLFGALFDDNRSASRSSLLLVLQATVNDDQVDDLAGPSAAAQVRPVEPSDFAPLGTELRR